MQYYKTFGPFAMPRMQDRKPKELDPEIPKLSLDFDTKKAINPFWKRVQEKAGHDLRNGCGFYIFVTGAGKGYRPWYVGQAKKTFGGRIFFKTHREITYPSVVDDPQLKAGKPYIFLIAKMTPGGNLVKADIPLKEANFIENLLIIHSLTKNPDLKNKGGTNFAKQVVIPGIFGDLNAKGKLDASTKSLRTALGIA